MSNLEILKIHRLRGPNIWSNRPNLEAWIDLGDLKDTPSNSVTGFCDRIKRWFPTMIEHRCSIGTLGGFFQRLDEGTWPAHILEHLAIELQTLAGHDVGFGKARETCVEGLYKVVIAYCNEIVAECCLCEAREILLAAYAGREYDITDAIFRMKKVVAQYTLAPITKAILEAAEERQIPWRSLQKGFEIFQFGQGIHQRRIQSAQTDHTRALSEHIAAHKELTGTFLHHAGIPFVEEEDEVNQILGNKYQVLIVNSKLVVAQSNSEHVEDVTERVHPHNREHFIKAAQVVGLDICGIDLICKDISMELEKQNGAIVRLHAGSSLFLHLKPIANKINLIGKEIVELIYPEGKETRVPLFAIAGSKGKTTTVQLISHLLSSTGKFIVSCSSKGLQFGERFVRRSDGDRLAGSHGVLLHPQTEIAICEASPEMILTEGLGFDRCNIAVVLNVFKDDLGLCYIDTMDKMSKVHRCVVDIVPAEGTAVLNADDPFVAEMVKYSKGQVIYFSCNSSNPLLIAHRNKEGKAVYLQDDTIYLAEGNIERRLCKLTEISLAFTEHFGLFIENVLAAVGAVWAYGLRDCSIITCMIGQRESSRG